MGKAAPPYYYIETIVKQIEKIAKLDAKINELFVEREQYVEEHKIDKIAKLDVKINEQFILREHYVEELKKAIEAQNTVKEQS